MKYLIKVQEHQNRITMVSKKIILIIAIALVTTTTTTSAQTSVFDKFDGIDDVTTMVVSKKAFELMIRFGGGSDEAKNYADMVRGLDGLKVFITENKSIANDMNTAVKSYLKSGNLDELLRVNDKDGNVRIYIKEGRDEDHVKELLMFINGIGKHFGKGDNRKAEAIIVSLTGNIDLNKIAELTEKMNIPGSEHLKKAGK